MSKEQLDNETSELENMTVQAMPELATQGKLVGLRQRIIARGKKLYPEDYTTDDYDDDAYEAMVTRLLDSADDRDDRFEKMRSGSKSLFRIFQEHPETYEVFSMISDGTPLPEALMEVYGEEALQPNKGSDFWKEYEGKYKAKKEREERVGRNIEESNQNRSQYYEEAGMTDEEIEEFEKAENALYEAMAEGRCNKDYFNTLSRALNRDRDVDAAYKQGSADGRNSKIKNELRRSVGDGLPHFDNDGGSASSESKGARKKTKAEELFASIARNSNQSKW